MPALPWRRNDGSGWRPVRLLQRRVLRLVRRGRRVQPRGYRPDRVSARCAGRGMIGLSGALCTFCKGSCIVTTARAEEFDEEDLPEKECPHCNGTGIRGLVSDLCPFCKGDTFVSPEKFAGYDPEMLDEVECPHCNGAGT